VFHVSILGGLEICLGGAKASIPPIPVATALCWELLDEQFAFCGWFGTVCVELLNRGNSTLLIDFLLRATKQEWKSAQKKLRHCVP